MDQNHPFLNDIPAYALGALDPGEASALEAHLPGCEICRKELASYHSVKSGLLLAAESIQPPVSLRTKLQERLTSRQVAERPRFSWFSLQFGFGLAVIVLLGLNIYSQVQIRNLKIEQARLVGEYRNNEAVIALLSYPGTRSIPINSGNVSGSLLLNQERNTAGLMLHNLPALQANQTYQAWFINPQGGRTSAGIFQPGAGETYISVPISPSSTLTGFTGLGVTVEPAGGSPQPTGQRLFKIDF